jgi:hypothetical protein
MRNYMKTLLLIFILALSLVPIGAGAEQKLYADMLRIFPGATLPTCIKEGELRVHSADSNKLKKCTAGTWTEIGSGGGGGAYIVTGTRATPQKIQTASAISFTVGSQRSLNYICGSNNGANCNSSVVVVASPQIQPGTIVGQELTICGASDFYPVTINHSTTEILNGTIVFQKNDCLALIWGGTDGYVSSWVEIGRNK